MLLLPLLVWSSFGPPRKIWLYNRLPLEMRIETLLKAMTIEEKLGQMSQTGIPWRIDSAFKSEISRGRYGSVYGGATPATRGELQRIATTETRLGIPLIMGADVIHGYATGLPIPLGQAASWDPALVEACARNSAKESASVGIKWTFSPMMDIARDPRWGRIAEGYGEDPYLASVMGVATVQGYQGKTLSGPDSIAACGKHYVGYGAAEGGRDYNETWIPENLLRDVYLKPFQATRDAGIATFMSAFNTINGVPASANALTLRQILKKEWGFDGFEVSDYEAVKELIAHGVARNGAEAARLAIQAGVDMEMVSDNYFKHGKALIDQGQLDPKLVDESVRAILRVKFRLGLFDQRDRPTATNEPSPTAETKTLAQKLASESLVLLKNEKHVLPLPKNPVVAVIGPLADDAENQLGTWSSADSKYSVTPLSALRATLGTENVLYSRGIAPIKVEHDDYSNYVERILTSDDRSGFADAIGVAKRADYVLLFLGETNAMSGEANSRANLNLPGAQSELVSELTKLGKPMIGIVLAGRPLTIHETTEKLDALIYAWHPGSMTGGAISDLLLGTNCPSGRLPVSFPRSVGQVPLYYDHLSTGRPASHIGEAARDHYRSKYLDIDFTPEYPFGYGLSYSEISYASTRVSADRVKKDGAIRFSCIVTNKGSIDSDEVVQFYVHQKFASIARPVRELKGFQRIHLKAKQSMTVTFDLKARDLAFTNSQMKSVVEPGPFEAWIAPDSASGTPAPFEVVDNNRMSPFATRNSLYTPRKK